MSKARFFGEIKFHEMSISNKGKVDSIINIDLKTQQYSVVCYKPP